MSPTGRLIGRSGELAGKKFELSGDTTIARGGTINISGDARARIFVQGEDFYIEGTGVVVDGTPVTGPTKLERMHVLEIGGLELVFTRTAQAAAPAAAAAPPPAPEPAAPAPPPPPPPPSPPPPPPVVETERTVVDMQGFGALPDLTRKPEPAPVPEPPPAPAPAPVPEERERTVVDMMGFGALPTLQPATPAPIPAPVVEAPAPVVEAPAPKVEAPAPVVEAPAPARAPVIDDDRTVAIPAAQKPQRQFVLVVNIPNEGPRTFPLKRGDNVLGRGDASDIKLPDPEQWLSRKHAMVRVADDDSIELIDLNGVNGTFVKGARVETAKLQPGATFVLGPNLEFKVQEK